MGDKADEVRARAESRFKKQEQRSREAEASKAEEAAKRRAVDDKTARLKGLRLAKEAADRDAAELAKLEEIGRPGGGHARRGTKKP